jgi:hypothetical protein
VVHPSTRRGVNVIILDSAGVVRRSCTLSSPDAGGHRTYSDSTRWVPSLSPGSISRLPLSSQPLLLELTLQDRRRRAFTTGRSEEEQAKS